MVYIYCRFFPIREGIQVVPTDDIWKLLYKHVQSHYPSLKQAFLQIDAVRVFSIFLHFIPDSYFPHIVSHNLNIFGLYNLMMNSMKHNLVCNKYAISTN